jgi:hypothetical protein
MLTKNSYLCLGLLSLVLVACSQRQTPQSAQESSSISHQAWSVLLQKHVDQVGWVDYEGFLADKDRLQSYLDLLSKHPPATNWSREEQLAYWINAYNAFTVKVIIDHYPLESIRELHTLPLVATIWHEEFFEIGGQPASLDQIEHRILRKEFNEPRIHFAINCASVSCPVLRNEAYTASQLENQLTEQARSFLNDPIRNQIGSEVVKLSKIFRWFSGDFTQQGSLLDYLNQYAPVVIAPDADVEYLEYNWSLNVAKNKPVLTGQTL